MVNFTSEKVTDHILRIYGAGDACMYFLMGSERGILVDTAYGLGDLRGYVESIWDKPYDVVITHGHADHANGIAQWDQVYMNSREIEIYKLKIDLGLRRTMLRRTVKDIDSIPDSEFHGEFKGEFLDLEGGMEFNLGGVTVQTIHAPGHTQGMMALLVKEDRVILFGDACGENTFLFKPEASTVVEYIATLKKLKEIEPQYDRVLRQHGSCESEKSILDENLEVAEMILAGKDARIPFEYLGQKVWMACEIDPATHRRVDGKAGNIYYIDEKIR